MSDTDSDNVTQYPFMPQIFVCIGEIYNGIINELTHGACL